MSERIAWTFLGASGLPTSRSLGSLLPPVAAPLEQLAELDDTPKPEHWNDVDGASLPHVHKLAAPP
jgi:hypothetical protein